MSRLTLDDTSVSALVSEVAPLVSAITGWRLDLPSLVCRVLPRQRGYEEIVEARLERLGLPAAPQRDLVTSAVEVLVESNVLAAYEPLTGTLLVVRENVDDSNLDGLRLILGHELTHRGQHIQHPALFERVNRVLVDMIQAMAGGEVDPGRVRLFFDEVQPIMTLIESHASYVQQELHRRHFPAAQIERQNSLPAVLFRVLGFGKTAQYTQGLPQVTAAVEQGGIDRLFRESAGG